MTCGYFRRACALLLTCIFPSGCALIVPQAYVKPQEVTLPQAMKDLACGLKTLQNESAKLNIRTGGIVDQVDVTLNLKASATGDSTLVVDAKPALPATVGTLGLNYTDKTEIVGSRDNQVKITIKNVTTASLNDFGKAAAKRSNLMFDMGPAPLYPEEEPCVQKIYDPRLVAKATKINSPVRK